MELQIIQLLNYATGQKNHSEMKVHVTNTNSMESLLIDVWNFLLQVCIVKTDVSIVGDQWNSMIH